MTVSNPTTELEFEQRLSAFRLEKWLAAEGRLDVAWNDAIDAALACVGRHRPYCFENYNLKNGPDKKCWLCWKHGELRKLKKLDSAGFIPLKERIYAKADDMIEKNKSKTYRQGVKDMLAVIEKIITDKE